MYNKSQNSAVNVAPPKSPHTRRLIKGYTVSVGRCFSRVGKRVRVLGEVQRRPFALECERYLRLGINSAKGPVRFIAVRFTRAIYRIWETNRLPRRRASARNIGVSGLIGWRDRTRETTRFFPSLSACSSMRAIVALRTHCARIAGGK